MNNRIQMIDVLRGIILFGVILVNAATINGPYFLNEIDFAFIFNTYDLVLAKIISIIFLEKSYPIFVFLFGVGTQLLLSNIKKKYNLVDKKAVFAIFSRRMVVLGIFGFIHGALFYWGDVLLMYSVLGFLAGILLIYIFNNNYKSLFGFNLVLITISMAINGWLYTLIASDRHHAGYEAHYIDTITNHADDRYDQVPEHKKELDNGVSSNKALYNHIYQYGAIQHIIFNNLNSYYNSYLFGLFKPINLMIALHNINYLLEIFILIILGAMVASIPDWSTKIKNFTSNFIMKYIAICGLINLTTEWLVVEGSPWWDWLKFTDIILIINNILLYLLIFLYVYRKLVARDQYHRYLKSFAAVGSMTLSWYLLQSLIMGIFLFNYGFGLYGTIGVADCFIFSVIYYYICYKVSPLWLQKFKYGPVEKFWRWLTMPKAIIK